MHHGAAPLGNVNVQLGTIGGGSIPKSNAQAIGALTPEELRAIEEIDNLLSHVSGVNDERDTVPILLGLRERWPIVRHGLLRTRKIGLGKEA